jgi:hypothetical protein
MSEFVLALGTGKAIPFTPMETLLMRSGNNLLFWCPGCNYGHPFDLTRWQFNGDYAKPTFTPSLLVNQSSPEFRCHLFVRNGNVEFCADCAHELKGQTVAMVPWEKILGGDMEEPNPQAQQVQDPTAAPAPQQPGTQPDPTATAAVPPVDLSNMAGGPSGPPPAPIKPVDPAKLEEAILHLMKYDHTREQAEKVVASEGVDAILDHKRLTSEDASDEEDDEEELPEGHEAMKQCPACATWHSKGELNCPQCGQPFPVVRG